MQKTADSVLPEKQQKALDTFCQSVAQALAEELRSIILFGGLARGDYYPQSSDINLALVFRHLSLEKLRGVREPLRASMVSVKIQTMLLTENDLERSADAFPTKFLLMKHQHRVLHGDELLAGLVIDRAHLRLRCEQEYKNLLLRMRNAYVRAARPERLQQLLSSAVTPFLSNLRVLSYLAHGQEPGNDQETLAQCREKFEFDCEVLDRCLQLKCRTFGPSEDELTQLYEQFLKVVDQAAEFADQLEVS